MKGKIIMEKSEVIVMLSVNSLTPAPWNPPQRTMSINLRSLVQSIKKNGFWLSNPIRVADNLMIIDGHRRWMAAKLAGIEQVPVYIDHSGDPKSAYLDINSTIRPPTSREWLHSYLSGGKVPSRLERDIDRLRRVCGESMLWRIAQANLSPKSLIQVGVSAAKYIDESANNDETLKNIIFWMVEGKRQWQIRAAIFYGRRIPIEELRNAINENRDIDLSKVE